jgi:hypothetical protein
MAELEKLEEKLDNYTKKDVTQTPSLLKPSKKIKMLYKLLPY